jgi:SAM-dependent methyltransferase
MFAGLGEDMKLLKWMGFDFKQTKRFLRCYPRYVSDLRTLKRQAGHSQAHFPFGRRRPCLDDMYEQSGSAKGHYFHQDLLVARRIFTTNPRRHLDIGSRLDGFVAHVAVFRPIEVLDIRPLDSHVPNVSFAQCDLMGEIPATLLGAFDSLSCLHALEHFGLGRYGDPLDYDGYRRGFANLKRFLEPNGRLYFSVPIGPQRIEFNAHRVFAIQTLLDLFKDGYVVEGFSYVDDKGDLHEGVELTPERIANSCGCRYGCGVFELRRV